MKLKTLYFVFGGVAIVLILFQMLVERLFNSRNVENYILEDLEVVQQDYENDLKEIDEPIVLWWSPLAFDEGSLITCGNVSCFVTHDRRYKGHPLNKAVIFYGSLMSATDLPLPRRSKELLWVLFQEDSPRNFPPLTSIYALSLFNLSATFSQHSSFPLTLRHLKNIDLITSKKYFIPVDIKNKLMKTKGLAPVLYIQSNCNTPSNRDSYVAELMKYIKIDSYGHCLKTKEFPNNFNKRTAHDNLENEEFLHFVAQYKFTITFEDVVCYDYISDKLWRALTVGSIPIYHGSPTVSDWAPNKKSAILIKDFESPKSLSQYLHYLNKNETEYNSFLSHKLRTGFEKDIPISNKRLLNSLHKRKWIADEVNHIEHFECFICESVHKMLRGSNDFKPVTKDHYDCENPTSPITRRPNSSNWWIDAWRIAGCEALVMNRFVSSEFHNYTHQQFYGVLEKYFHKKIC